VKFYCLSANNFVWAYVRAKQILERRVKEYQNTAEFKLLEASEHNNIASIANIIQLGPDLDAITNPDVSKF